MKTVLPYKFYRTLILIVLFIPLSSLYSQKNKKDALFKALRTQTSDTGKVKALNDLAWELKTNNVDTAIIISSQALALAENLKWEKGIATSKRGLGVCNRLKGNYAEALNYLLSALETYTKIKDKSGISAILGNIGIVYKNQSDYPKALEYYFKALKMAEELKDKEEVARHLANIGLAFLNQGNFDKAREYSLKALKMYEAMGDNEGIERCYGGIGNVFAQEGSLAMEKGNVSLAMEGKFPKALEYYSKGLKMQEVLNNKSAIALYLSNTAIIYKSQALAEKNPVKKTELFNNALDNNFKALKLNEEIHNKIAIGNNFNNIGVIYLESAERSPLGNSKLKKAEEYLLKGLAIHTKIGALNFIKIAEHHLSVLYSKMNKHQLAFEHIKKYINVRDSLFNTENRKKSMRAEMNFEFEKKEAIARLEHEKKEAVAKAKQEKEKQQHKIILISVLACLGLMIGFAIILLRAYTQKKKSNHVITLQKLEVEKQKEMVEQKQKEILDSIHYAKRIQSALLTSETYINRNLQRQLKG
ncbi:MAG: tetratricopeptide repeat protein [Bacteroidetes bacterium]|nr:tetratricopeptide repeat protein [Bacteroidota bacterium]